MKIVNELSLKEYIKIGGLGLGSQKKWSRKITAEFTMENDDSLKLVHSIAFSQYTTWGNS